MDEYLKGLSHVLTHGRPKVNRTGTDTLSVFGYQMRFDLRKGFPLVTTKKMFWRGIVGELLWLISGSTNVKPLQEQGIHIWDEWADINGELGPVYGTLWRNWLQNYRHKVGTIDQLQNTINDIRYNPTSRRLIVTAWSPSDLPEMRLPPCHMIYQFNVREPYRRDPRLLDCGMTMRSTDIFLGLPFNIASYALLTHMVARCTGMEAGDLVINFGDLHLYNNHIEQAELQLSRTPKRLPKLANKQLPGCEIDDYKSSDLILLNYESHPAIKAEVAV